MALCKNCNNPSESKFCPHCGQEHIKRITIAHLTNLILHTFELESGLLLNLKELTIRPHTMILSYLNGRTKDYFNPFTYFLISITFFALMGALAEKLEIFGIGVQALNSAQAENGSYAWIFILLANISFAMGNYIVFHKKWNVLESWIISLFIIGHINFILAILYLVPNSIRDWFTIIPMLYFFWAIIRLYDLKFKYLWYRLLGVMIISLIFIAPLGFAFISIRDAFPGSNNGIAKKEFELFRAMQTLEKNTKEYILTVPQDSRKIKIRQSTNRLVLKIKGIKNRLIEVTGGQEPETGDYIGGGNKSTAQSLLFTNSELAKLKKAYLVWQEELKPYDCEWKLFEFNANNYKDKTMIEVLIELNNLSIMVLTIEKDCLLSMSHGN